MESLNETILKKKRVRASNFTTAEKKLLLKLAIKYKTIVDNKKTDQISAAKKMQVWRKIADEFNSNSPNLCWRSVDSLKKLYKNRNRKVIGKQVLEEGNQIFYLDEVNDKINKSRLSPVDSKTILNLENQENPSDSNNLNNIIVKNCGQDPLLVEIEESTAVAEFLDVKNLPSTSIPVNPNQTQWKKTNFLRNPVSESLKHSNNISPNILKSSSAKPTSKRKALLGNARRPYSFLSALSSSRLAQKYEILLDKRVVVANYESEKVKNCLEFQKEEYRLRLELLRVQLEIEKNKLRAAR